MELDGGIPGVRDLSTVYYIRNLFFKFTKYIQQLIHNNLKILLKIGLKGKNVKNRLPYMLYQRKFCKFAGANIIITTYKR